MKRGIGGYRAACVVFLCFFSLGVITPAETATEETATEETATEETATEETATEETAAVEEAEDADPSGVTGEPLDPYEDFITGDLTSLGAFDIIPPRNRIGLIAGYRRIGNDTFLTLNPVVDYRFGEEEELKLGLGLPLNLYVYDAQLAGELGNTGFENRGRLRSQDYSELGEFLQIIRYLTYGRKEADIYLDVGSRAPTTIGHGTLVRRLNPNINVDRTQVGAQFDAYWDWAGFQAHTSNLATWEMAGALAFFRPLGLFTSEEIPKSLSFGLTYFHDLVAPSSLQLERGLMQIDRHFNPVPEETELLASLALNFEFKFLKTRTSDIKVYAERSGFTDEQLGSGYFGGLLGRFNLGNDTVHAFRARTEYRTFDANYVPSYFDTFYEITQYQFNDPDESQYPLTKLEVLRARKNDPRRHGCYLELTYGLRDIISLGLAYEHATAAAGSDYRDSNFIAHIELPLQYRLQVFATYYRRNPEDLRSLFELGNESLLFSAARFQILPIMYLNLSYQHSFQLEDLFEMEGVRVANRFSSTSSLSGNLEMAFEF